MARGKKNNFTDINPVLATITEATEETKETQRGEVARFNLYLSPEVGEYIKIMAKTNGMSANSFFEAVMKQHMEKNREVYDKILELRKELKL